MFQERSNLMYAAIRRYTVKPDSADGIKQRTQEGFVPLISSLPGFVAYYGVLTKNNTVITVSIFTDQAGEEASTRQAAAWVQQNVAQYVEGTPEIIAGPVTWHATK
jgi:heme-degrading monooxygenase HmoA